MYADAYNKEGQLGSGGSLSADIPLRQRWVLQLRNFYGGRKKSVLTDVYPVLFLSQIETTGRLLQHTEPLG